MSYITVPAEKVIKCCQNWILYDNIRDCQNAAVILAKKAREKKYIFFGEKIGYQAAFDYYMNSDDFTTLKFHACFYNTEINDSIENLLTLAQNGDPVMVTDKHAFIFRFEDITFDKVD